MATLTWNAAMGRYEGVTADGRPVTVDGDVLAEARQKAQREELDPNAAEVMSADVWATREDGDDDNGVNVYCARCGCHSAVAESSENGTADGCQCACHEDCIARGEG